MTLCDLQTNLNSGKSFFFHYKLALSVGNNYYRVVCSCDGVKVCDNILEGWALRAL